MSENQQENERQDPAEPYKSDTEVQTTEQPDPAGDDGDDSSDEEPATPVYAEPPAQPLTPEPTPTEPTTSRVGGRDYDYSAERGHREVPKN